MRYILIVLLVIGWIGGVILWSDNRRNETIENNEQRKRDLADPSVPPVLSDIQADPSWSIRKWLSVDEKSSDCEMADEMMDNNATVKTIRRRRGSVREYYLADYISSCQNFSGKMFHEIVEPQANKWCLYRKSNQRFEELCGEWLNNKDLYLAELRANAEPTLERYRAFVGQ